MKIFRKIKITSNGIIASLLIGILGSAIYEHIFLPLSSFVFYYINNWISQISRNSSDRLYRAISLGFNEKFATLAAMTSFFSCVLITLLSLWLFLIFSNSYSPHKRCNNGNEQINNKISEIQAIMILIETVLLIFTCFYFAGKVRFINSNVTKCLNNIEIVSPYVSDFEYKKLKSSFYQISSKEDFDSLFSSLREIALRNDVTLK